MQNLAARTLQIIENSTLDASAKALLRCELAKELEETGEYEAAREALGELWRGIGERPDVEGLGEAVVPYALLRAGALTGWLGTARQLEGSQEAAKDLIGESIRGFEALGETARAIEGQNELALCYWREGAFDEARVVLRDGLARLEELGEGAAAAHAELKARLLLRGAIIELQTQRPGRALQLLTEAGPLVEACEDRILKGKYHGNLAMTLRHIAEAEGRADYLDRALVEYAASNFHFEEAGHLPYCARGENNLAMLFLRLKRYEDAHEHLDRAHSFFVGLRDEGSAAQVRETRARVYLAEGRHEEAERAARTAVETLERGAEKSLLAEAMTTRGVALARLGRFAEAQSTLASASEVAEAAGDVERGGLAALALLEELGGRLGLGPVCGAYARADRLLAGTRHEETSGRLRAVARFVIGEVGQSYRENANKPALGAGQEVPVEAEANLTLLEAVRRYEGEMIRRALEACGGSITKAAERLGISHQTLSAIIRRRHRQLLENRKPRKRRQVSIINPAARG